ncbi:hypothetical protein [Corallibacter sp.]|uniref:hypothetical protein n=1 Tax=Corallibacter sp. TaxID=2038084 RepID=UPI003A8F017F
MKRLIKNSLVLVALFTTLLNFGNVKAKETYVTFSNVKKGSLLSLKDEDNQIIYKEEIQAEGYYSKKFDFTLLPTGNYYFELEKDLEINTKPFSVTLEAIDFHEEKSVKFYKPIVSLKGSKVLISQLTLNKKPLDIKLYYEDGIGGFEMIYATTLKDKLILETILKLSEERTGTYKLILKTENYKFEEILNL